MKNNERLTGRERTRRAAMMLPLTLTWMLLATGCATPVREISSDRMVRTLRQGQAFTAPCDGKFVPESRWLEMQDVYIRHSFEK